MPFAQLIGNERVKQELSTLIQKQITPSLLLFTGIKGIGKFAFARAFARELLSLSPDQEVHPDLHVYHPQGKAGSHPIEAMQQLIAEASLSSSVAKKKIFVIDEAEAMLPSSSNALLKTLEEPENGIHFVLITSYPARLLPTILSRGWQIAFQPIEQRILEQKLAELRSTLTQEQKRQVTLLAGGSLGKALLFAEEEFLNQCAKITSLHSLRREGKFSTYLQHLKEIDTYLAEKDKVFAEALTEVFLYGMRDQVFSQLGGIEPKYLFDRERNTEQMKVADDVLIEKLENKLFNAGKALSFADRGIRYKTLLSSI